MLKRSVLCYSRQRFSTPNRAIQECIFGYSASSTTIKKAFQEMPVHEPKVDDGNLRSALCLPRLRAGAARARAWLTMVAMVAMVAMVVAMAACALASLWLPSACSNNNDTTPRLTMQPPLAQDAYIWQRQWTGAVSSAMQASEASIHDWRVLAGERDERNGWTTVSPAWSSLRSTNAGIIMVFRINGRLEPTSGLGRESASDRRPDADTALERPGSLIPYILQQRTRWQAAGLHIAGIEIDHDCATARLPAYTEALHQLKRQLGVTPLSITALPTWLESPALDSLLAVADSSVLQLHAVMNPRLGLFDADKAYAWLDNYSRHAAHAGRPWQIALPTYSTHVGWDENGTVRTIESERPMLHAAVAADELVARPEVMARFVETIAQKRPAGLNGVVWFRLPTENDARAWGLPTWLAVLRREPLTPVLTITMAGAIHADPALRDIILSNTGNADGPLPRTIRLARACSAADGINGYALDSDAQGLYLKRTQEGLLRAGRQRTIGWLRCPHDNVSSHVQS
jgi:hypothetical protein